MPFSDFVRRWFGGTNATEPKSDNLDDHKHHRHNFRNPIWQNEDDDDDDRDDFRHPGNGTHFTIDSDPMEIAKFFESEIDQLFKTFLFGPNQNGFSFFTDPESGMFRKSLPSIQERDANGSLRNQVLKPGLQEPAEYEHGQIRMDGDIDGKLSAEELGKIWGGGNDAPTMELVPSKPQDGRSEDGDFIFKIKLGEGKIVEKLFVADAEGNVRTTETRQIDGKTHIVTTVKDKNGAETRMESLINMNEDDLKKFNEVWIDIKAPGPTDSQQHWSKFFEGVDWNKYFGPNPKL